MVEKICSSKFYVSPVVQSSEWIHPIAQQVIQNFGLLYMLPNKIVTLAQHFTCKQVHMICQACHDGLCVMIWISDTVNLTPTTLPRRGYHHSSCDVKEMFN